MYLHYELQDRVLLAEFPRKQGGLGVVYRRVSYVLRMRPAAHPCGSNAHVKLANPVTGVLLCLVRCMLVWCCVCDVFCACLFHFLTYTQPRVDSKIPTLQ